MILILNNIDNHDNFYCSDKEGVQVAFMYIEFFRCEPPEWMIINN